MICVLLVHKIDDLRNTATIVASFVGTIETTGVKKCFDCTSQVIVLGLFVVSEIDFSIWHHIYKATNWMITSKVERQLCSNFGHMADHPTA